MDKISSGIKDLDKLVDALYVGDNIVWEVDAGTSYDVFIKNFIVRSFRDFQKVIYVSFNKSPQSILNEFNNFLIPEHFILVDCFTSGKGKNDNTFLRFYETANNKFNVIKIENPKEIDNFTSKLNSIEDSFSPGARYVFDSLTGMQDLWADENDTYKFFTYMCPRLYDLDTVAYWILEKDAHSQKFKANLRHITQVVFDLSKRREHLFIKALKLTGRTNREAFKPHFYEIIDSDVIIKLLKKETITDVGPKIKELRVAKRISQKELAEKVELTPSFISQLESNQISPSLSSFIQICNALGVKPSDILEEKNSDVEQWLFRKSMITASPISVEEGIKIYNIVSDAKFSALIIEFPGNKILNRHFFYRKTPEFIYILSGNVSVNFDGRKVELSAGDSFYLKESFPSGWKNEGGDNAEILVVWF